MTAKGELAARRSTEPVIRLRVSCLKTPLLFALAVLPVGLLPAMLHAQEVPDTTVFEQLGLDRLHLVSFGGSTGVVFPSQMESAPVLALVADYGEIRHRWRVVFTASYWDSKFTDEALQRLRDSLATIVVHPAGEGAVIRLDQVRFTVLSVTTDVRRQLTDWRRFRPYIGAGFGAYATNVEADGLSGTLVENAFDTIAAGVSAITGAEIPLVPNFALSMHARYDLVSGYRAGTLRVGGAYVFAAGGGN